MYTVSLIMVFPAYERGLKTPWKVFGSCWLFSSPKTSALFPPPPFLLPSLPALPLARGMLPACTLARTRSPARQSPRPGGAATEVAAASGGGGGEVTQARKAGTRPTGAQAKVRTFSVARGLGGVVGRASWGVIGGVG